MWPARSRVDWVCFQRFGFISNKRVQPSKWHFFSIKYFLLSLPCVARHRMAHGIAQWLGTTSMCACVCAWGLLRLVMPSHARPIDFCCGHAPWWTRQGVIAVKAWLVFFHSESYLTFDPGGEGALSSWTKYSGSSKTLFPKEIEFIGAI